MAENSLIRQLEEDHSNSHLVLVKLFKDGTRFVNLESRVLSSKDPGNHKFSSMLLL